MKVAALIPARSGSVRVTDKNVRVLGKYPLLARKIKQLQSGRIDEVFLGSNDPNYLGIAEEYGATPILRSDFSCNEEEASANDMIADFVKRIPEDFDVIVWAHCTNPFLFGRHYDAAITLFQENSDSFDSILSVQRVQNHMWASEGKPVNYNPWSETHALAKSLEPVFFQTGGIFIQWATNMKENSYFFGEKPKFIIHDEIESTDIDTELDFLIAENLVQLIDEKENFS